MKNDLPGTSKGALCDYPGCLCSIPSCPCHGQHPNVTFCESVEKAEHKVYPYADAGPWNSKSLVGRWTRLCWWLSRHLGGRSVFGKSDAS